MTTILEPYSEIALSQKLFRIGHMYIHTFLLRMPDTMTSQNIDLHFWDTLYIQAATERCRKTLGTSFPHQNKKKCHIDMSGSI
jgi:hypothetical protein